MEKISKNTEQQNQIDSGEIPKNTKQQNRIDLEKIMRKLLPTFQDWLYVGEQEIMKAYFNDLLEPLPFAAPESSVACTASEAEPNTTDASTEHTAPEVSSVSDTPAIPAAPEATDTSDAPTDSDTSDTPATSDASNDPPAKKTVLDDDEYFQNRIPADVFENADIAKEYGKRLRALRLEKRYSLDVVSNWTGLSIQNIQLIETGQRKRIDRNRLLLFCGLYQEPPEDLLGHPEFRENRISNAKWTGKYIHPLEFDLPYISEAANFILDSLLWKDERLLQVFLELSLADKAVRRKAILFLSNMPILKVLRASAAKKYVAENKQRVHNEIPAWKKQKPEEDEDWRKQADFILRTLSILSEIAKKNPSLFNIFVSILASPEETRMEIVSILSQAGFLSDRAVSVKKSNE